MANKLFTDIYCRQVNFQGERICGDTFASKRLHTENRTVIVLSDGMGHGVKANVLSTLTSSMMINFAGAKEDIYEIARIVLNNLLVCSIRKISYSTFTVIDIDHESQEIAIAEHDNPHAVIFRNGEPFEPQWHYHIINEHLPRPQKILTTRFRAEENDRLIMVSDGVTQSGLGTPSAPFGWGQKNLIRFLSERIGTVSGIASRELAVSVVAQAVRNDGGRPKDDISCVSVHLRRPRRMLLASCPPLDRNRNGEYADLVFGFEGTRVVCGYPIAEIIAGAAGKFIRKNTESPDPDLPPVWEIEGLDLVSEGIITLNKVFDLLVNQDTTNGNGPAHTIARELIEHDEIHFVMGTKQRSDSNVYKPDEYELRRNTIKRIASVLETRYRKEILITLI